VSNLLPDEFTAVKCIEPCPYGEPYFLVSIAFEILYKIFLLSI